MRIEWIEGYMADAERLIVEGRVSEGMAILNNLLYEEPGYGALHNLIGWANLYYAEDAGRAELRLKMACRFSPDYPAPFLHLGTLYNRTHRYAEALTVLEAGLNKPGSNLVAFHEHIGLAHEYRGHFGRAIKAYREAAMASVMGFEMKNFSEGIRRCRRKRRMRMFSF